MEERSLSSWRVGEDVLVGCISGVEGVGDSVWDFESVGGMYV